MSSPRLAIPDSPQPRNQLEAETGRQLQQQGTNDIQQQAIANLAYELWEQRGCPVGSRPETFAESNEAIEGVRLGQVCASGLVTLLVSILKSEN